MYTEKQVDDMLSQVEQEFEKALGSINKNEDTEVFEEEEVIAKSEEDENDYETVDDLYDSMDKSEKEAHYTSIKKSLAAEYAEEEEMAKTDSVLDGKGEATADEKRYASQEMSDNKTIVSRGKEAEKNGETYFHNKGVKSHFIDNETGKKRAVKKSEDSEVEMELMAKNEELQKNLDTVNGLLDKIFNKKAPAGKAITNTSYIAKSEGSIELEEDKVESMSKSEITLQLNKIDYTDLSKTDRNAINDFCLKNGTKESIKHLI